MDATPTPRRLPQPRGLTLWRSQGAPVIITPGWIGANIVVVALGVLALVQLIPLGTCIGVIVGVLGVWVAFVLAIVIHEFGHVRAARRHLLTVSYVAFTASGGYTAVDPHHETPRNTHRIALAGPLANLAAGTPLLAIALATAMFLDLNLGGGAHWPGGLTGLLLWPLTFESVLGWPAGILGGFGWGALLLAGANGVLALMNLLPGAPLDGGVLLRARVWQRTGSKIKGERAAAWGGLVVIALAVILLLTVPLWSGWQAPRLLLFLAVSVLLVSAVPHVGRLRNGPAAYSGGS